MKISDFKNEEALDLLVEIIDPVSKMMTDQAFIAKLKGAKKMEAVKIILKDHKSEIIEILAKLNGQKVEEYQGTIITMTVQILEILNDEDLVDFFISQGLIEASEA